MFILFLFLYVSHYIFNIKSKNKKIVNWDIFFKIFLIWTSFNPLFHQSERLGVRQPHQPRAILVAYSTCLPLFLQAAKHASTFRTDIYLILYSPDCADFLLRVDESSIYKIQKEGSFGGHVQNASSTLPSSYIYVQNRWLIQGSCFNEISILCFLLNWLSKLSRNACLINQFFTFDISTPAPIFLLLLSSSLYQNNRLKKNKQLFI